MVALTRRGFGESSQPATGYDPATLAEDIRVVLDTLGVDRVDLVGHSIAGVEMTQFAIEYPERVNRIVYLDAAYDWALQVQDPPPGEPPTPPQPASSDLASSSAFAAYVAQISGLSSYPEADVRATNLFGKSGRYVGPVTPSSIAVALATGAAEDSPNYPGLQAPALAIFTVPDVVTDMFPWLDPGSTQWDSANTYFEGAQALLEAQREGFTKKAQDSSVVEMHGVPHFLFLADALNVESSMRSFLLE